MSQKITQEVFEKRCKEIHGDFYDYSLDTYKGMEEYYNIGCPVHGIFKMKAVCHTHLKQKCPQCQLDAVRKTNKKKHTSSIKTVHKDKYIIVDWSNFKNADSEVVAKCKLHGNYTTTVKSLLRVSYGDCPRCKQLQEGEKFIEKAKMIHGDKYFYDKENYKCSRTLMTIFCTLHDKNFTQRPSAHLQGQGCPECGKKDAIKNSTLSFSDFIAKSQKVHGNFYDYSQTVYKNCQTLCNIVCPIHGEFKIRPNNHFHGLGCVECNKDSKRKEYEDKFLKSVCSDHRYSHLDFSRSKYVNNRTKVEILCKLHNEWFTATPNRLLDSSGVCGCKICASVAQNRWSLSALNKIPDIRKKVGHFYTGNITNLQGIKIGITGNTKDRLYGYNTDLGREGDYKFDYISTLSSDYFTCAVIEVVVKKFFKKNKVKHNVTFGGKNEVYDIQGHGLLTDIFSGRWDLLFNTVSNLVTNNSSPEIEKTVKFLKSYYDKK